LPLSTPGDRPESSIQFHARRRAVAAQPARSSAWIRSDRSALRSGEFILQQKVVCAMGSKPPVQDDSDVDLTVSKPKRWAAGIPSLTESMPQAVSAMGPERSL